MRTTVKEFCSNNASLMSRCSGSASFDVASIALSIALPNSEAISIDDMPLNSDPSATAVNVIPRSAQARSFAVRITSSRIVAYMQANASSMPIIQNQIGILPSKYCTAVSSSSPVALTMIDRWSGTRRYSTAIYTMQAAHSQIAVYERGMSGRALVIGVIDGAESTVIVAEGVVGSMFANPCSQSGQHIRQCCADHLPPPI